MYASELHVLMSMSQPSLHARDQARMQALARTHQSL